MDAPMLSPSRVFLTAEWRYLTLVNFEIPPEKLRPFVPWGTELDFFEGKTFVSLVGFRFSKISFRGVRMPVLLPFEQVNLRFYVKREGAEGVRRGVVFLKEIASSALAGFFAGWFYGERYLHRPLHSCYTKNEQENTHFVSYGWKQPHWRKQRQEWNRFSAVFEGDPVCLQPGTLEEFMVDRRFAYTLCAVSERQGVKEFCISRPPWRVWSQAKYAAFLHPHHDFEPWILHSTGEEPSSVFVVDGSPITLYESWLIS